MDNLLIEGHRPLEEIAEEIGSADLATNTEHGLAPNTADLVPSIADIASSISELESCTAELISSAPEFSPAADLASSAAELAPSNADPEEIGKGRHQPSDCHNGVEKCNISYPGPPQHDA